MLVCIFCHDSDTVIYSVTALNSEVEMSAHFQTHCIDCLRYMCEYPCRKTEVTSVAKLIIHTPCNVSYLANHQRGLKVLSLRNWSFEVSWYLVSYTQGFQGYLRTQPCPVICKWSSFTPWATVLQFLLYIEMKWLWKGLYHGYLLSYQMCGSTVCISEY